MLPCFKAYDIRGRVPAELNEALAERIGRAYAQRFQPRCVALVQDMRLSSPALTDALAAGLMAAGVDVVDLGMGGTELAYFAAFAGHTQGIEGAIAVTASHNPADYNGMKMVQKNAIPISGDSGLRDIEQLAESATFQDAAKRGQRRSWDIWPSYVEHMLGYVHAASLPRLKVVMNGGHGCAGLALQKLAPHLPLEFVEVQWRPDGTFPTGVPNPLLPENRAATADVVVQHAADLGIAFDGDHDRCFFFDHTGAFIEGYYMVGLFAVELLRSHPGAAILHDPRLTWNTIDLVTQAGGRPVMGKTGHAFIKEHMRKENAVYGGEMSAHHYFRDFAYCDSGMIPWLLLAATMGRTGASLQSLVQERQQAFPASGEINLSLRDAKRAMDAFLLEFEPGAVVVDRTDGVSIEHAQWRANVRASNTEPVLRVNVESRGDVALMEQQTKRILGCLHAHG
jgi:phosphomannomutase